MFENVNLADKVCVIFLYNFDAIFNLLFGSLLVFLTATYLEPMDCIEIKQIHKHFNCTVDCEQVLKNGHILSFPISHHCLFKYGSYNNPVFRI